MEKAKYSFRGMELPVKASKVGPYLEKLANENAGKLEPKMLLEKAKNPKDLMYPCFDWDNKSAANKWRMQQARTIIASVVVTYIKDDEKIETRAFVNIAHDEKGNLTRNPFKRATGQSYYVTVSKALSSPALRIYTLESALQELEQFQRKYAHLTELAGVFAQLKKVKNKGN
jgi:hypothetical protein